MRSVELTLGESTDSSIRADWARLLEAGLPSLATHTSPSNRPHITLAAGNSLDLRDAVQDLWGGLPIAVRFSGLVVFPAGSGKYVLARLVVPSAGLLQMHARLHQQCTGAFANTLPDAWTPHVTLARRIPGHLLGTAMGVLDVRTQGECTAARLWDSPTRTTTALSGE
ncbi:2'-5' RNA ligase family protein [Arthrobacter sp. Alg241-R88]|uniref:2'-5' RNA ligase family protein n=1 Tax=Arthrobacter sp. Alg241-R88 TaxID=2305984 RepID=UPI0013D09CC3|nr:2'-5' RNA ligase family protein [Arthrobacter sp. Alg241-R88]